MVESDQFKALFSQKRIVIVGVGNPLRSDDGVGSFLAKKLIEKKMPRVFDGADVPESYTGEIKALSPQVILFVDAVDFKGNPGDVAFIKADQLTQERYSSHRPALGIVAKYLAAETNADVLLLGIQPQDTSFGSSLSMAVSATVDSLLDIFSSLLTE